MLKCSFIVLLLNVCKDGKRSHKQPGTVLYVVSPQQSCEVGYCVSILHIKMCDGSEATCPMSHS